MQSGLAGTKYWVLEFAQHQAKAADPLTGWIGGAETETQLRLKFNTSDEAVEYAKARGLEYDLIEPQKRKRIIKSYADNFAADRKDSWTH